MSAFTDEVAARTGELRAFSVGGCSHSECCGEHADEGCFSWRPCESCGSSFGGNRYPAHYLDEDGEVMRVSVCGDCLLYHANGDEPDDWRARP